MNVIAKICLLFLISFPLILKSQSLSFALTTSPNISFDFNTVQEYEAGIARFNACVLNIEAVGTEWDLYVGATTSVAGQWDVTTNYSTSGSLPTVDMVQVKLRNSNNTSLVAGFFPLQDILTPTYIIGSSANDATVACPAAGTNTAGSYLTSPGCYLFHVDLKITPGFIYRPGLYTLRIDYIIIEDL